MTEKYISYHESMYTSFNWEFFKNHLVVLVVFYSLQVAIQETASNFI